VSPKSEKKFKRVQKTVERGMAPATDEKNPKKRKLEYTPLKSIPKFQKCFIRGAYIRYERADPLIAEKLTTAFASHYESKQADTRLKH